MKKCGLLAILMGLVFCQLFGMVPWSFGDHSATVKGKTILVVASYHKGYKWVDEIIFTLERELVGADLSVFYMDSKMDIEGAPEKAKKAYEFYLKSKPDAVITIDDNAQSYFVVPYLKDKVATPVIFCGVNDDATKYGYPASNVTGVLEKKHYRESISFVQLIQPEVQNVAVLYRPTPSNTINLAQIEKEKTHYSAEISEIIPVETLADVQKVLPELDKHADALLLLNMSGIRDEEQNPLEGHDIIAYIAERSNLVTIGASDWEVEAGALCGVIKTGEEQGVMVAHQLVSLWEGNQIKEIPVQQNRNGQRYINVQTMKKLNMQLKPAMIIGTKIIGGN